MTNIEKKIQKLEAKIMLDPKMYSLDPIRNHRIKVRLFNIARGELLEQDLKEIVKKWDLSVDFLAKVWFNRRSYERQEANTRSGQEGLEEVFYNDTQR